MKRFNMAKVVSILIFLTLITGLSFTSQACEAEQKRTYIKYNNNKAFETDYHIWCDRILVPLYTIVQMGLEVNTEEQCQTIEVYEIKTNKYARFKLDSTYVWIYQQDPIRIDVPPMVIDDITYIPLSHVAKSLGKKITSKETKTKRTITITNIIKGRK